MSMGKLKCKTCKYLLSGDDISMISRMMGYTAECTKTGVLFNLEKTGTEPIWCPLINKDKLKEKL